MVNQSLCATIGSFGFRGGIFMIISLPLPSDSESAGKISVTKLRKSICNGSIEKGKLNNP
jgi:hypothetical protein